jgi:hypothetical protein
MMKRLITCVVLALPLALSAQAAAKEVVSAKVCGAGDCRTVKDHDQLIALQEGGPPTDPPDKGQPSYTARLRVRGDDDELFSFRVGLVPSAGLIRGENDDGTYSWLPVSDRAVRSFREMTRGLEPFAPRKLRGLGPGETAQARVDEVFTVDAPRAAPDEGGSAVPWIAAALAAAALLGGALGWTRHRRRGLPPRPASGPASS